MRGTLQTAQAGGGCKAGGSGGAGPPEGPHTSERCPRAAPAQAAPPPLAPSHLPACAGCLQVLACDIDLLHPPLEVEKEKHKLKRLVESPSSHFMDVKCPTIGCATM